MFISHWGRGFSFGGREGERQGTNDSLEAWVHCGSLLYARNMLWGRGGMAPDTPFPPSLTTRTPTPILPELRGWGTWELLLAGPSGYRASPTAQALVPAWPSKVSKARTVTGQLHPQVGTAGDRQDIL